MKFLLYAYMTILLSACKVNFTPSKELNCPSFPIECKQQEWKGIAIDTGHATANKFGDYNLISQVSGLENYKNVYSLSQKDSYSAILSYAHQRTSNIALFDLVGEDEVKLRIESDTISDTHLGFPCYANGNIYFAQSKKYEDVDFLAKRYKEITLIENQIGKSRLYKAQYNFGELTNIQSINTGVITDSVWESHPSISKDETILFFASDRSGGYGGSDIWYMVKNSNNEWSYPINCGAGINTECNEFSPFLASNSNELYFSSIGHESVGGYDLFKSKVDIRSVTANILDDKNFSKAENLRSPINTQYDELFPQSMGNPDSLLFYSSNQISQNYRLFVFYQKNISNDKRHNRTNKDIAIEVKSKDETHINVKTDFQVGKFTLEGTVREEKTDTPIQGAVVTVKTTNDNKVREKAITDNEGKYSMELEKGKEFEIVSEAKDLFYNSFRIKVDKDDTTKTIIKESKLPEVFTLRINFPYDIYDNPYEFTLDTNGMETSERWEDALDKVAENIKNTVKELERVELIGHTDDIGGIAYNNKLGKDRVDFIARNLIDRGVQANLLVTKSSGKSKLLKRKYKEDIDTYRKRLRRVNLMKIYKKK